MHRFVLFNFVKKHTCAANKNVAAFLFANEYRRIKYGQNTKKSILWLWSECVRWIHNMVGAGGSGQVCICYLCLRTFSCVYRRWTAEDRLPRLINLLGDDRSLTIFFKITSTSEMNIILELLKMKFLNRLFKESSEMLIQPGIIIRVKVWINHKP